MTALFLDGWAVTLVIVYRIGTSCKGQSAVPTESTLLKVQSHVVPILEGLVSGVAQWLGRRSLAGGLSLIFAGSMVDM